jgi:hypothetical protein
VPGGDERLPPWSLRYPRLRTPRSWSRMPHSEQVTEHSGPPNGRTSSARPELQRLPNTPKDRLYYRLIALRGIQRQRIEHIIVGILHQPHAHKSIRTRSNVAGERDRPATCEPSFGLAAGDETSLGLGEKLPDRLAERAQRPGELIVRCGGKDRGCRSWGRCSIEIQRTERVITSAQPETRSL